MTPAYQGAKHIPLNLALQGSCLFCHSSFPQEPSAGTENRYSEPLLSQTGIGCERCHGPGAAHAAGREPIVNPAKLSSGRRDDICMQCHLEGDAAVLQAGKHLAEFRAGDDLQEYVHYLVLNGAGRELRAASQFEALAESRCKQKTGNAFTCTTCHDPHVSPEGEKNAYFNRKCIACHESGAKKSLRHLSQKRDCVSCHMPRMPATDIAHTQATDHRILLRPDTKTPPMTPLLPELLRFSEGYGKPTNRDLALGWQSLARSGWPGAQAEAEKFLKRALETNPDDPSLLAATGFLLQKGRRLAAAGALEQRALNADPLNNTAAANLGVIAAQAGDVGKAEELWKGAFGRDPASSQIGINLAKLLADEGKIREAEAALERVLEFNPDLPEAETLLHDLKRAKQ